MVITEELAPIAVYIHGLSRSEIGRLLHAKLSEVRALEAQIVRSRRPFDADDFPTRRDRRRIAELGREIQYLTSVFEPDNKPMER
jgi:hypothetical protein